MLIRKLERIKEKERKKEVKENKNKEKIVRQVCSHSEMIIEGGREGKKDTVTKKLTNPWKYLLYTMTHL